MNFPDFYELSPVVQTRDPFAAMLGAARDGLLEYHYVDAVRLAGHSCPTVAGAYLIGRAALRALYPDEPAARGSIAVHMPAPENEGTTGVMAQVLTLLTGAAADNGFHGIQGRFRRMGLLSFADQREGEAILFKRLDTGASVAVEIDERSGAGTLSGHLSLALRGPRRSPATPSARGRSMSRSAAPGTS